MFNIYGIIFRFCPGLFRGILRILKIQIFSHIIQIKQKLYLITLIISIILVLLKIILLIILYYDLLRFGTIVNNII
jgi:hypothetical protein